MVAQIKGESKMTETRLHTRGTSNFKKFVRSVLDFVLEYGWLFFGWVFLTSILVRAGMSFFALVVSVVWAMGIKSSQASDGGEILKDLLSHALGWFIQHMVAFFAIMTLTRTNWSAGTVIGLVICITAPTLTGLQISRWHLGRSEKLAAIARADAIAASHMEEMETLEAQIRAEYVVEA